MLLNVCGPYSVGVHMYSKRPLQITGNAAARRSVWLARRCGTRIQKAEKSRTIEKQVYATCLEAGQDYS